MGLTSWNAPGSVYGSTGRTILTYGRAQGRVEVSMISDSNGQHNSRGWGGGFHTALQRFEMHATPMLAMKHWKLQAYDDPAYGSGAHARYGSSGDPTPFVALDDASVPAALKLMSFPTGWTPYGSSGVGNGKSAGLYLASGNSAAADVGMVMKKHGPVAVNYAAARYEMVAANTQNGAGTVYPGAWDIDYSAGQFVALGTRLDGAAGATSLGTAAATGTLIFPAFTLAAQTRINGVDSIIFGANLGANTVSPAALLYQRVFNPNRPRGFAFDPFLCKGGASAYDMAAALQAMPDATLDTWLLSKARGFNALNGGSGARRMLFIINAGFNDPAQGATSLGPNPAVSSTAAGYVDNHRAIFDRIRTRYDVCFGAGAEATECYFFCVPSHPISDSPTTSPVGYATAADKEGWLVGYRAALSLMPDLTHWHNVTVVNLPVLMSATEISNGSHVVDTTESPAGQHLNASGYNTLSGLILDAVLFSAAPAGPVAYNRADMALAIGIGPN